MLRQALSLTYGRFFAEFLKENSLVRLGLLALSTCVGFSTDSVSLALEVFRGSVLDLFAGQARLAFPLGVPFYMVAPVFAETRSLVEDAKPLRH